MPGGGLTGRLPVYPAFTILPAPIPPAPFPSGEGGDYKLVLPGASPPAPLRLCLCGTGGGWGGGVRRGACSSSADAAGGGGIPGGGLTGWLPVYPTFTVLSAPIPPAPFPAGRGRIIVFLCKGLRPLHPRGWVGSGTGGGWKVVFDRMACPRNRARTLGYGNNNSFGKVLGGLGDSFKSPPAYPRISPPLRV